jgi:hypothetical protein
MIRFKVEVRVVHFDPRLALVLEHASVWSLISGIDVDVNSVDDGAGVHKVGSLHGSSLAIDLDTAGDKSTQTRALAEHLRRRLHPQYDVILERDHVHVEWDAHRPALPVVPT